MDALRQAIDAAALVTTPAIVASSQEIEQIELPAIVIGWVSDAIDDEGTTAQDGTSLQTRILEVEVTNMGFTESDVEDVAEAIENVVFREFEWSDFISAEKEVAGPDQTDRVMYGVKASFGVQYEKQVTR